VRVPAVVLRGISQVEAVINRRSLAPVVRVAGVAASRGVLPGVSRSGGWPSEGPHRDAFGGERFFHTSCGSFARIPGVGELRGLGPPLSGVETLATSSSSTYFPQIKVVERACGFSWAASECWGGTVQGDRQSFTQVVKKLVSVVMVPPRQLRGWGREGFDGGRYGRGWAKLVARGGLGTGRIGKIGRWRADEAEVVGDSFS
jgi:hypothetical protein